MLTDHELDSLGESTVWDFVNSNKVHIDDKTKIGVLLRVHAVVGAQVREQGPQRHELLGAAGRALHQQKAFAFGSQTQVEGEQGRRPREAGDARDVEEEVVQGQDLGRVPRRLDEQAHDRLSLRQAHGRVVAGQNASAPSRIADDDVTATDREGKLIGSPPKPAVAADIYRPKVEERGCRTPQACLRCV